MIGIILQYIGLSTVIFISIWIICTALSVYFDNKVYSVVEHDNYPNNVLKHKKLQYAYIREILILFTPGFYTSKHEEIKEEINQLKYD